MKGVSVLSKERLTDYISKQKIYNYIKTQINPYGKPFDGTAYEFGLKIMDYIKNSSCDEDLEELKQCRDLEEQGLLLRLPCKVGDTVWVIVEAYSFGEVGDKAEKWYSIHNNKFDLNMLDDFGKTVFLTQSEAEEKLRELEDGECQN